jgi:amino acid permease
MIVRQTLIAIRQFRSAIPFRLNCCNLHIRFRAISNAVKALIALEKTPYASQTFVFRSRHALTLHTAVVMMHKRQLLDLMAWDVHSFVTVIQLVSFEAYIYYI